MPIAAATSSWPRPANWRSSTTLAATGSSSARATQRLVEREKVVVGGGGGVVGEVDPAGSAAPLLPPLPSGRLDEDAPHGLGGRGEEVGSPVPGPVRVGPDQPQVRLVDQRGGLERLPSGLVRQVPSSQPAQFGVDQREEVTARLPVAP